MQGVFHVYLIKNSENDKLYVGVTTKGYEQRFSTHKYQSRKNGRCSALYAAMRKHGDEKFSVELLEVCSSFENMNERERHWIKELNTMSPNGYNLTDGGDAGVLVPESMEKVRAKLIGRPIHEKTRQAVIDSWTDPESRAIRLEKIKEAMNRPEVREQTGARQRGVKKSASHVASLRKAKAVKVMCVNTGEVFDAMIDAVQWVRSLGVYAKANHAKIIRACTSESYTAYGYRWKRCG